MLCFISWEKPVGTAPLLQKFVVTVFITMSQFPHLSQVFYTDVEKCEKGKKAQPDSSISKGNSRETNSSIKKLVGLFSENFASPTLWHGFKIWQDGGLASGMYLGIYVEICQCLQNSHPFINDWLCDFHKGFAPSCMAGATEGSNWVNRDFPPAWPLPLLSHPCLNTDIRTGLVLQSQCSCKGGAMTSFGFAEWEASLGKF